MLLVFLQCIDAKQPQPLSHDRLAIAVPVDATVAHLHSLIQQRYQQLIADEDEDSSGTHRIAVRRVYKVAEFAYVVSRHESVGEVFANEEPVQADVSIRLGRDELVEAAREEVKDNEETEQIEPTQRLHAMDGSSHTSLRPPTLPLRSASPLKPTPSTPPIHKTTPTTHSQRTTQLSHTRLTPTSDRSVSTSHQRQSHGEEEERDDNTERTEMDEVEGGKKLDKQLVQRFNTFHPTPQRPARADTQSVADIAEQKESFDEERAEADMDKQAEVTKEVAVSRGNSSTARLAEAKDTAADSGVVSRPKRRRGKRAKETSEKTRQDGSLGHDSIEDDEMRDEDSADRTGSNALATPVQSARPLTSVATDNSKSSSSAVSKKSGRPPQPLRSAAAVADATLVAITSPPPSSPSSAPSSSDPAAVTSSVTSVSLSAVSPSSPLLVAGPSNVKCILCGQGGGVLKLTRASKGTAAGWCHQMCATWCDGTAFSWKDHRVYGVTKALTRAKQGKLQCKICRQPVGTTAPVLCVEDSCDQAFHITCGVAHQYQTFEAEPDEEAQARGMQEEFVAACPQHNNPRYDEKNDDDCCICLYTRPSQPEMSARLTCVECGVRVHRTCYYNLPSDSVNGEDSEAEDGQIDWQHWTCMCCEFQRSGKYYFVSEDNQQQPSRVKQTANGTQKRSTTGRAHDALNGKRENSEKVRNAAALQKKPRRESGRMEDKERKEKEVEEEKAEESSDEMKQEVTVNMREKTTKVPATDEQASSERLHNGKVDEDTSTDVARTNGKRRPPAATRGSGTTNKRQKVRQETFKKTGFTVGRASAAALPNGDAQDGTDREDVNSHATVNGTAADTDEEKVTSTQSLRPRIMSPVSSRAASAHKSPPMAPNLDPRRSAAIRRLEENANREKLTAITASTAQQQVDSGRSARDQRAALSTSTPPRQQQQRSSSSGLIINTIRASASPVSLSQPTTPSSSSSHVSYPRSTLSRKEYIHAVSRYPVPTLRAVLHHHNLNYTGTREGLVARLMATTVQLPGDEDERQQWEQAWEREAGEDKDKEMLRMPDREFKRHKQQRHETSEPHQLNGKVHAGGLPAAVAGFGPASVVQRLRESAELAEAVEEETMEEEEVDDINDDSEDESEERDRHEPRAEDDKLQEALSSIEEVESSSEEAEPTTHPHNGGAATNGTTPLTARGRGEGAGRGGRGRGKAQAAATNGHGVKPANGYVRRGGSERGRGRGQRRGRA